MFVSASNRLTIVVLWEGAGLMEGNDGSLSRRIWSAQTPPVALAADFV